MTPCSLMLTPLLRYTGLNRNCHVRLSWHLMRINSAYRVQQEEFTTASVQTSVAVKSRSTAHTEPSFLHRGDAPVRLAGDVFRPVQVQEGRFLLPAFTRKEICWAATGGGAVSCYSYLQKPCASAYILKSQTALPKKFLLKCIFS